MTEQFTAAAEHIEVTNKTLEVAMSNLEKTAADCADRAKRQISNLKNLQGQLGDAVINVNKRIKPAELEALATNAERLVGALKQLDELEKRGALTKFASMLEAGK